METQQHINYVRIAKAIEFLRINYKKQPSLEEAASHVNLSEFHFQRMFREWAGITPKQFLQYISVERAKEILKSKQATLSDTAFEIGLSGTSRLHDLFIKIEAMTPGEYKNGGEQLKINYSFYDTPFGSVLMASTTIGICYMAFADEGVETAWMKLKAQFPNAHYQLWKDAFHQTALNIFTEDWTKLDKIKLHLKGTSFQIKIWETLLKIPMGNLITYTGLANDADHPLACRAVGSAVARNPVAFLIPCHRVIKTTGELGQYHWGSVRKNMIVGWEASKSNNP